MSRKNHRPNKKPNTLASIRNDKDFNNTVSQITRKDGWQNVLTGIGAANSRVNTTTYGFAPRLDKNTLTNIYTTDCIARQVVNIIIDDAMRGFINADDLLLEELNRLQSKQKIIDTATWARLYGGAALVAFADDGQEMEEPLNVDRLKKVVSLQVYDRWQLSYLPTDINEDFYSEHYGNPEVYTITPVNGIPFRVHRTRMHLFKGNRIPREQYINNNYWDDSVIQSLYEPLRNYGQTMNATSEIVQDFVQTVIGINGLTEMLSSGKEDLIINRLNIIDLSRSVANTVLLDAEHETYSKHASSVSGLSDLLEKQQEVISSGGQCPITKLFGTQSKGLGNSGLNDPDNWNNTVEAYRGDNIEPSIKWLIPLLEAQSLWTEKPQSFDWTFPALKVSNEHEIAKNRLLAAQTDQIYMDRGAVDPEFLFKKRYSGSGFQTEIFISEEEMEEIKNENEVDESKELEVQQATNEIKQQLIDEQMLKANKDSLDEEKNTQQIFDQKLFEIINKFLE